MTALSLNTLRSAWHRTRDGMRRVLGIYSYAVTWRYLIARLSPRDPQTQRKARCDRYLVAVPAYASEGIGGQFVKWNTARLLARRHGLTFVHHPFTSSSHSPGLDWEHFLGFGAGEVDYSALSRRGDIDTVDLPPLHISRTGVTSRGVDVPADFVRLTLESVLASREVLFRLGGETWTDAQAGETDELKRKYHAARRAAALIGCAAKSAAVTVAVHVRRGDVRTLKDIGAHEGQRRWIDETYYASLIAGVNRVLGAANVQFRIYSDDPPRAFEQLPLIPNVQFRLHGQDPVAADIAFHEMVTADILAVGMSSFSYLAALLSDGVKLAPSSYPHDLPADWLRCDSAGAFDGERLLSLFAGRLALTRCPEPANS